MQDKFYFESNINRFSTADSEINYQQVPFDIEYNYKLTNKSNPFSDCGAWFGYYTSNKRNLSFTGPMVISQEIPINIAHSLSNIYFVINNKVIKTFTDYRVEEKNGYLQIYASIKNKKYKIDITKKIYFINHEDALIELDLKSNSKEKLEIKVCNKIELYKKVKYKSSNGLNDENDWVSYYDSYKIENKKLVIKFDPLINKQEKETFEINHSNKIILLNESEKDNIKTIDYSFEQLNLEHKTNTKINWFHSFYFNRKKFKINFDDNEITSNFLLLNKRWQDYKKPFKNLDEKSKLIAYKSIYTLIGNWLAPNGKFKHDTVVPSITYTDFIGAYAWDVFKISYGLSYFNTELAKACINSMFDYQIKKNDLLRPWDYGMIPDCIFYNYSSDRGGCGFNWNERNTKPPLASWSVLKVFEKDKDIEWLKKIYPKLIDFQQWWMHNRKSQSQPFFLSYGATLDKRNSVNDKKTIIEAISWESGMDNAPRFDWDRMTTFTNYKEKLPIAYVCDQNSICLNSFYYLELISLLKIEKYLNLNDSTKKANLSLQLKNNINQYMWSNEENFYYDIKFDKLLPLTEYGKSVEQFLPLYIKITPNNNASKIIKSLNKTNFLTPFPFPTVSFDNQRFDPVDYWRGPVWISFLYFALKGIYNYDKTKALKIKNSIINTLSSKEHLNKPLRENYHPINKKGLSTTNFSWTSSLLISLIKEIK
ncbi:MGH1-like glycoside hydrolase domain-containing protein [Malacoplasma iowae]|uniref:MGH1-like glycoside hydrolase domain-containing protein n=1 Tax=Malacoplasma iowae TaxID=2116 RepID=UPI003872ED28|nr:trehalase family glycosidase [Malacoplasma iowae]